MLIVDKKQKGANVFENHVKSILAKHESSDTSVAVRLWRLSRVHEDRN